MTPTAAAPSRAGSLPLVGGDLAFDFCNTASGRGTAAHLEHFASPENVIAWARHAGAIAPDDADPLNERLRGDPSLAGDLLRRAHQLREAVHDLGVAIAAGHGVPQAALDALAATHATCMARAKIAPRGSNFGWRWEPKDAPLEAILGPVAVSAVTLLRQADLSRVKRCCGEACGWLFLDTSKNKSRRWCEMEVCGNRAKQKRHQDRRSRGAGPRGE